MIEFMIEKCCNCKYVDSDVLKSCTDCDVGTLWKPTNTVTKYCKSKFNESCYDCLMCPFYKKVKEELLNNHANLELAKKTLQISRSDNDLILNCSFKHDKDLTNKQIKELEYKMHKYIMNQLKILIEGRV
jgi:hypothetical protein